MVLPRLTVTGKLQRPKPINRPTAVFLVLLTLLQGQLLAQEPDPDSAVARARQVPTPVLAIGGPAVALALMPFDRRIRGNLQGPTLQDSGPAKTTSDVFRQLGEHTVPAAFGLALLTGWALDHEPTQQGSLHVLESLAASALVVTGMKLITGRARPFEDPDPWNYGLAQGFDGHGYRSFPSGHTSQAFALATSVQDELNEHWGVETKWLGIPLYSAAALTGFSRMYHDRHWASDVIMGAAVGTLVARVAQSLNHPRSR